VTAQEIRAELHKILDRHDDLLAGIRTAHQHLHDAFTAHDAALVNAIEANRSAIRLLNRIMDEGREP